MPDSESALTPTESEPPPPPRARGNKCPDPEACPFGAQPHHKRCLASLAVTHPGGRIENLCAWAYVQLLGASAALRAQDAARAAGSLSVARGMPPFRPE